MKSVDEIKEEIRQWVVEKSKTEDVSYETPLLENRIISSLQIMDMLLFMEKLSGRKIDVKDLEPGVFKDINSIYTNFFGSTE